MKIKDTRAGRALYKTLHMETRKHVSLVRPLDALNLRIRKHLINQAHTEALASLST